MPSSSKLHAWLLFLAAAAAVVLWAVSTRHALATPPTGEDRDLFAVQPGEDPPPTTAPADDPPEGLRKLTEEEINRIRFLELRGIRMSLDASPDRVIVKIPQKTVDDFLVEMEGHPDFRGERPKRDFRKLTPAQKLHVMAWYRGRDYADKVDIRTDPEVFVTFRRNIMPVILRSCATSGCHQSASIEDDVRFTLFRDPKRVAETTYANFIMLDDIEIGRRKMINRAKPEESLLLTYLLPEKEVKPAFRHPRLPHLPTERIRPLYQSRSAPGFVRIQRWIESLKHPKEDYGVRLGPRRPVSDSDPDLPENDQP